MRAVRKMPSGIMIREKLVSGLIKTRASTCSPKQAIRKLKLPYNEFRRPMPNKALQLTFDPSPKPALRAELGAASNAAELSC